MKNINFIIFIVIVMICYLTYILFLKNECEYTVDYIKAENTCQMFLNTCGGIYCDEHNFVLQQGGEARLCGSDFICNLANIE